MSEIVVVGSFTAREGKEADALAAFEALVEPTHGEDGCILYALHQGIEDPRRLAFVERWASQEVLAAHLDSDHVKAALARAPDLFEEGSEIIVYEARPAKRRRARSPGTPAADPRPGRRPTPARPPDLLARREALPRWGGRDEPWWRPRRGEHDRRAQCPWQGQRQDQALDMPT
jgi:quinol monooxygenase YgiN